MDLARYYGGLDLLDLHRGRLSWRRLRVLIDHLPPESATKTAMRLAAEADGVPETDAEPADAPWSQTEMLLAVVIDRLGDLTYVLQRAHGGKPEKPKPLPRPGVRRKKKKPLRPLNAVEAEWLFRHINGLNQAA